MKISYYITDAVFIARPVVLVSVWGFSVLGYYRAAMVYRSATYRTMWKNVNASGFLWMVVFSLSVAAVFIVNQIADSEVDRDNDGFPLLINTDFSTKASWFIAAWYGVLSVCIPLAAGYSALALLAACALGLGMVYSLRPFYFSGRPGLDFLSNAAGYGVVAFCAGWVLAVPPEEFDVQRFAACAIPYFLLMCGGSISSTIPDIKGDRAGGKITTAVYLGERYAHFLATAFVVSAGIGALLVRDPLVVLAAGISLPLYIAGMVIHTKAVLESTYKVGGGMLMIVAGIVFPLFALSGIAVFFATRLYFSIRHKIKYPSLLPAESMDE
ncbi:MAG: hypothetical protein GF350_10445 [Chitinivibrionales bacterium]|nr:hypothetical protein [Chitinivibrionales bacterium]